jgi:hypothetical protein
MILSIINIFVLLVPTTHATSITQVYITTTTSTSHALCNDICATAFQYFMGVRSILSPV